MLLCVYLGKLEKTFKKVKYYTPTTIDDETSNTCAGAILLFNLTMSRRATGKGGFRKERAPISATLDPKKVIFYTYTARKDHKSARIIRIIKQGQESVDSKNQKKTKPIC